MLNLGTLPELLGAVAGLGVAAAGIVDALKAVPCFSRVGFHHIERGITRLLPEEPAVGAPAEDSDTDGAAPSRCPPITVEETVELLKGGWLNGADLSKQKADAKTLVIHFVNERTALHFSRLTSCPDAPLKAIAIGLGAGGQLAPGHMGLYKRFSDIIDVKIDSMYQRADQQYKKFIKFFAYKLAIALAVVFGVLIFWDAYSSDVFIGSVLIGMLAGPLASASRDTTTGIGDAVRGLARLIK